MRSISQTLRGAIEHKIGETFSMGAMVQSIAKEIVREPDAIPLSFIGKRKKDVMEGQG